MTLRSLPAPIFPGRSSGDGAPDLPGFESRSARHVRESVEGKDLPVFVTALLERAAFRELHLTGQTPRQTDPTGTAAANANPGSPSSRAGASAGANPAGQHWSGSTKQARPNLRSSETLSNRNLQSGP